MSAFLSIAASVGTPLSLIGLVMALGYFAYTRRLEHQERKLRALPLDQRPKAADEYLTRYGIDGSNLRAADKLTLIRDELDKRHRRSLLYVLAATVTFVACFAIAIFGSGGNADVSHASEAASGTIAEPTDRAVLKAGFKAVGTAQNVGEGVYLWIAVEINDRIWPKGSRITVGNNGQWSISVFEDGRPDEFGLSLWSANSEADAQLRAWLNRGMATGVYPDLRPLTGMKRLDRVQGLRVTPNP